MDPALRADWENFRSSDTDDTCLACGQRRAPGRSYCGICTCHMDDTVLAVCRSILHQSQQTSENEEHDETASPKVIKTREVNIGRVADLFPVSYALHVGRKGDALRKAGAWFAHVVAYQYTLAEVIDSYSVTPADVYAHPVFENMRDIMYEALYEVAQLQDVKKLEKKWSEDPDSCPAPLVTLHSVFSSAKGGEGGAVNVLVDMMHDLESRNKLRVFRGGGNCPECGASMPSGSTLCASCAESSQLSSRLSISQGGGVKSPDAAPPPTPKSTERMHVTTED